MLESVAQDARYTFRRLRRERAFAAAAILTIGLAVGLSTAIFSVAYAVLLRPLPYGDAGQLVALGQGVVGDDRAELVGDGQYLAWRERNRVFTDVGASRPWPVDVISGGGAESLRGERVTVSLLQLLRVRPLLGRAFLAGEDQPGHDRVAILSERLWRRVFGSDPHIIGKHIRLQDRQGIDIYEVVGVTPAAFRFRYSRGPSSDEVRASKGVDIFLPLTLATPTPVVTLTYSVYARLKPGVTLGQARAEMRSLHRALLHECGRDTSQYQDAVVMPLHEATFGKTRPALVMLATAAALVLLIGCTNVASLLLAHGQTRQQEMAVRTALGSGRVRLARQLMTENLLIGALGGLIGILLAAWGVWAVRGAVPAELPRAEDISLDATVLAFSVVVSVAMSLAFGVAPALRVWRSGDSTALKTAQTTGGSAGSLGHVLVGGEVALVMVLAVGAGLLVNSLWRMLATDLGLQGQHILTMRVRVSTELGNDGPRRLAFDAALLERVRSLPGVIETATASDLPFSTAGGVYGFRVDGEDRVVLTEAYGVDPAYLSIIGARLVRGRLLQPSDQTGPPVAVVNEAFATRHFPGANALGRRVLLTQPLEVVGVIGDHRLIVGREGGMKAAFAHVVGETARVVEPPAIYIPSAHTTRTALGGWSYFLVVRTQTAPETFVPAIRRHIAELDPTLAIKGTATFKEWMAAPMAGIRFYALILTIFTTVGLCLAAVGIYGLLAQTVGHRVREIGVRIALGATSRRIVGMVLWQTIVVVCVGLVTGLLVAWWSTRLLRGLLFDVTPTDPLTFCVVALVLVLAALVAAWRPARRATQVDPMVALRCE